MQPWRCASDLYIIFITKMFLSYRHNFTFILMPLSKNSLFFLRHTCQSLIVQWWYAKAAWYECGDTITKVFFHSCIGSFNPMPVQWGHRSGPACLAVSGLCEHSLLLACSPLFSSCKINDIAHWENDYRNSGNSSNVQKKTGNNR